MKRASHNLAFKESLLSETVVRRGEPEVLRTESVARAKELLSNFGIPAKNFAYELKVGERYVQLMANGEKPIQAWMIQQIISVGEDLLWKQKQSIDAYIRRALKAQFGNDYE